ncbi:MAG: hypothetical protein Q7R22_000560 [Verrucomicrobiota bacterium JB025]|nr:hypothetical protein [Verrucomicrobiota bacterium JB025]
MKPWHSIIPGKTMNAINDTTIESPATRQRPNDYSIYKPNSRGSGGVMRFGINRQKAAVFVDAASQTGDRQFDWENKITMKWGLADLGSVLATLEGTQPQAKLFHQSERANSAFELTPQDNPDRAPWSLSLSRQSTADQSVKKVRIPLTHPEAAILKTALRAATVAILAW